MYVCRGGKGGGKGRGGSAGVYGVSAVKIDGGKLFLLILQCTEQETPWIRSLPGPEGPSQVTAQPAHRRPGARKGTFVLGVGARGARRARSRTCEACRMRTRSIAYTPRA